MYTNDERFAILHTPGSNTWTLQIKFVQRRDHGMYECQVCFTFQIFGFTLSHSLAHVIYMLLYTIGLVGGDFPSL